MTRPCPKCPFLRDGPMKLRPARAAEIGSMFNGTCGTQGGTFPCHATLDYDTDEDGPQETAKTQHCAGALIFAEKHETPAQMMRICERLGMYDMRKLEGHDDVWDSLDEWVLAMEEGT
jgi:hypothetical protein